VYRLTEDVIMEFLPPIVKGGVSYYGRCKMPGVDSWTAYILKDPAGLGEIFDFLSRLEKFMQK
jgi:hypothetical protein